MILQKQRIFLSISLLGIIIVSLISVISVIHIPNKVIAQTSSSFTNESYPFITKWGSFGTANGQFSNPQGIAVDSSGTVYVADYGNNRVEVFAPVVHNFLTIEVNNKNITSSISNKSTSIIPMNKTSVISSNPTNSSGKNTTSPIHAGISDQF